MLYISVWRSSSFTDIFNTIEFGLKQASIARIGYFFAFRDLFVDEKRT